MEVPASASTTARWAKPSSAVATSEPTARASARAALLHGVEDGAYAESTVPKKFRQVQARMATMIREWLFAVGKLSLHKITGELKAAVEAAHADDIKKCSEEDPCDLSKLVPLCKSTASKTMWNVYTDYENATDAIEELFVDLGFSEEDVRSSVTYCAMHTATKSYAYFFYDSMCILFINNSYHGGFGPRLGPARPPRPGPRPA